MDSSNSTLSSRPVYVSEQECRVYLWGVLGFLITFYGTRNLHGPLLYKLIGLMLGTALPMAAIYIFQLKSYQQPDTGLQTPPLLVSPINPQRIFIKMLGFVSTLGILGFFYWLFPEYQKPVYEIYVQSAIFLPWIILLAIPYFIWADRRMIQPHDGYWHMGCLMLGRWTLVELHFLKAHAMGWSVKGFFLPFMYAYLGENVESLLKHPFVFQSYIEFHHFCWNFLIVFDLLFATLGYVLTLRCFNSHIRSTEPTCIGWCSALVCYQPFWSIIEISYLNYYNSKEWNDWLAPYPVIQMVWSIAILLLMGIYTWATLCFGFRFSNLTHRGIIRHGPYRYSKHPAYLCKNTAWWLMAIPFIPFSGTSETIRHCIQLLILNGIYWLRAVTEEKHLSKDIAYQEYASWIKTHGLLARIRHCFRGMKERIS
jgi:isoprenylcysteine carboxyl methyltransferase (ICMT) family protein YpbQ